MAKEQKYRNRVTKNITEEKFYMEELSFAVLWLLSGVIHIINAYWTGDPGYGFCAGVCLTISAHEFLFKVYKV